MKRLETIPDYILSIEPYKPGKPIEELEREYGIQNSVKLASNENPLGPSPKALAAVRESLDQMHRYPDGSGFKLTRKLAKSLDVDPNAVIIGNGSDDIIALLAQAFLNPGDEAVMPDPSFLMYEISVKASGGVPVKVPLKNLALDLPALAAGISQKTRLLFLTNPNNPTGSCFSTQAFDAFIKKVPSDVIVVVDEAYIEFVRDRAAYNCLEKPLDDSRIVCLRTFSKAYGLAGFRVGYGVMEPEIAAILHRVRQPFNVNSLAQSAAAAALDDIEFLTKTVAAIHQGVDYLQDELAALGLTTFPTQANFFLVDVETDASKVFEAMLRKGVIVRSMASYGYKNYIRVNTGLESENMAFLDALKKVLNR